MGKCRIQESGFGGVAPVPSRRMGNLRLFKGRIQKSEARSRKGRFQVSGSGCQGLNEESGVRSQESE